MLSQMLAYRSGLGVKYVCRGHKPQETGPSIGIGLQFHPGCPPCDSCSVLENPEE